MPRKQFNKIKQMSVVLEQKVASKARGINKK
jgi:hypothetical protein